MKKYILLTLLFLTTVVNGQSNFLFFFDDNDVTPPTAPVIYALSTPGDIGITSDINTDCARMILYRGTTPDTSAMSIIDSAFTTSITKTDSPLTYNTNYYYSAKGVDASGNRSYFSTVVFDTVRAVKFAGDYDGSTEYLSEATPPLALMGTYALNETFSDGDYTTGNVWTVSSGAYAVTDTVSMYSGLTYALRCATAGVISIPSNWSFGYVAFDWRKGGETNDATIAFISIQKSLVSYYQFRIQSSEGIGLFKETNTLGRSASTYITNFTTYRDSIVRNTNGSFSVYIKGGTFGDTYTLVSTTGGSGTNPVTDNTYTQSNYFVLDLDAGDAIANIQCAYGMNSMDLNGHEMVNYPYQNSSFEGLDTVYFSSNGTHSADSTTAYKYAGSGAMKITAGGVGDSTTNYTSLAYNQFQPIVAGNKYTIEIWLNADSTGTGLTTKPRVYGKLGSKSFWGTATDTISIYRGLFRKFAFTFEATTAEVNATLKVWYGEARTYYGDNFSIRQAKDFSKWAWIKTSSTGTNKMIAQRFASNNGLKLSINTSNQLTATIGDGTTTVTVTGTTNVCDGNYHFVGLTGSRTGNIQLYLDGATEGSASAITSLGNIVSTNAFNIGFSSSDYFNGQISEVQRNSFNNIASETTWTPSALYYRTHKNAGGFNFPTSYTNGTVVFGNDWSGANITAILTSKDAYNHVMTGTNMDATDFSQTNEY